MVAKGKDSDLLVYSQRQTRCTENVLPSWWTRPCHNNWYNDIRHVLCKTAITKEPTSPKSRKRRRLCKTLQQPLQHHIYTTGREREMSLNMQVDGSFSYCCCCVHISRGSIHYLGWWAARRSSPRASLFDFDFDVHAHWWDLLSRPPAKHAGRIQSDALKITRLSASSHEICSIRGRVLFAELRQSIVNGTCTVGGGKTKLHSLTAFRLGQLFFDGVGPFSFFYYLVLFSASALVPHSTLIDWAGD